MKTGLPIFTWPDFKKAPRGTRFRHNDSGRYGTFIAPAKNPRNGGIVVWDGWDKRSFGVRSVDGEPGHVYFVGIARDAIPVRIKAWDLIGFDTNAESVYEDLREAIGANPVMVRIAGKRALYEAVMYNDSTARSDNVKLARLDTGPNGIREVSRYVDPDTELELVEVKR